jgi:hypothetical protein
MRVTNDPSQIPPNHWPNKRAGKAAAARAESRSTDSADVTAERARQTAAASTDAEAARDKDAIHREEALRQSVAKLIESGDLKAAEDGAVRRLRVDEARKKLETGTYGRQDVIGGIVDRLLDQWKI